uniref:Uncharacterized protein n=1 Tax=Anguilla anguilla TaxID=7936 RepID=A0A0E9TGZ7_ANGAN
MGMGYMFRAIIHSSFILWCIYMYSIFSRLICVCVEYFK